LRYPLNHEIVGTAVFYTYICTIGKPIKETEGDSKENAVHRNERLLGCMERCKTVRSRLMLPVRS
jgi:hypothetical protein